MLIIYCAIFSTLTRFTKFRRVKLLQALNMPLIRCINVLFQGRLVRLRCMHRPCIELDKSVCIKGGGAGGGSGHRSQRFKTENHKSQSFQMMISQITDNKFSKSENSATFGQCFCTVLTDLQHMTSQLLKNNYSYQKMVSF